MSIQGSYTPVEFVNIRIARCLGLVNVILKKQLLTLAAGFCETL